MSWLKQKEARRTLVILRFWQERDQKEDDALGQLRMAMERGFSVIIEEVGETIDPIVVPVVKRDFSRRGGDAVIRLGDEEIEQHPEFRLYLQTSVSNPHFPPEIQAETTMVDFTVTPEGLEDRLLSLVVRMERPDLASCDAVSNLQRRRAKVGHG